MKLSVQGGSSLDVPERAFGAAYNEPLVHQVVTAFRARARAGTKAQKTRAEVRGGGKKPWRQKGTGRARAGSSRSPIWVGGGRAFAAAPRNHAQKVNRKMYQGAMRSVLSELVRQDRLVIVDQLDVAAPRTRELVAKLRELNLGSVVILVEEYTENLVLAARNLPFVEVLDLREVNPVSLIRHEKVLATSGAVSKLAETFA
jgi:large subunit ribosomal protein L4